MGRAHLKRLTAPKTWKVKRKGLKFITKPNPGPHKMEFCMPLNLVLRDILGYAKTTKETKQILYSQEILVDGRRRKEPKHALGFMDTLSIPKLDQYYRMLLDRKGYLTLHKIDKKESNIKPYKVINKTRLKGGKTQLNLSNGINMIINKDEYKCGETVILEMPKLTLINHIQMEKGNYIMLTGGKRIGDHGIIEDINKDKIVYKSQSGQVYETSKDYALLIGNTKPIISML